MASGLQVGPRTPPVEPGVYFLPRHRVGWWAVALLVVTSLYPVYFGSLENLIGSGLALFTVAFIIAVGSLGTGSVALFLVRDRSVLLSLVYAVAVFLVLVGLMFGLALLFLGL
ncbi:MAG TPA: hypothetical protein VFJ09_10320 [Nocardioidaceae bacterium]|nr:hypothetical protein [Nocardioidaceae bacterium]